MEKTENQKIIDNDILVYKPNKLASTLCILGLVFNCLYFMLLYGMKTSVDAVTNETTKFVSIEIGLSVILTLFTLLLTFLSSQGIKAYNKKYSIVLLVLAAVQIFRIFGYPVYGYKNNYLNWNYFFIDNNSTVIFVFMLVYLIASAGCLIASAIVGYIRAARLEHHEKRIADGTISMAAVLKEMDEVDAANAVKTVSDPVLDGALKNVETESESGETAPKAQPETEAEPQIATDEEVK